MTDRYTELTSVIGLTPDIQAYIDAVAVGLRQPKDSCRAATTANITLSGTQTIDGVSVISGDRVLVKNQSTGSQNGIYVCAAGAWSRATDADISAEVSAGLFTFIDEGSTNADTGWVLSTDNPITLGATALTFVKFTSIGGDFVGPSSSTDNALVRFDGTGGKTGQGSLVTLSDADLVEIPNTSGAGLTLHNTADKVTNTETGTLAAVSNEFVLSTNAAGTGTLRTLRLRGGPAGGTVSLSPFGSLSYASTGATVATAHSFSHVTLTSTTLLQTGLSIASTINQASGSGGYNALLVNPTLTAVGSAGVKLFRGQVAGADRWYVDSNGKTARYGTITAAATTGAQTINKPAGTVNAAAATTSVVVTNSLVSANSQVRAFLRTNDTTAKSAVCVAAAGSFEIFLNDAATAEVSIGFVVEEIV